MFTEFVDGNDIFWLIVVTGDLAKDLASSAGPPACEVGDIFGIDDDASWYLFLHFTLITEQVLAVMLLAQSEG